MCSLADYVDVVVARLLHQGGWANRKKQFNGFATTATCKLL